MLELLKVKEFHSGIDSWLLKVDKLSTETLRGLSVKLFEAVIQNTPQFSGNAVANWKYSVNGKDSSFDDYFKELFWEGAAVDKVAFSKLDRNDMAEQYAISNAAGRELGVTSLHDVIYISNSVDYEAWLAKATEANLREVNHVGHLISHSALDVIEGHLFINTSKAESLAGNRIV